MAARIAEIALITTTFIVKIARATSSGIDCGHIVVTNATWGLNIGVLKQPPLSYAGISDRAES